MSLTSYRAAPPRVKPWVCLARTLRVPCVLGSAGTPARRRLCSNRFPPWEGCHAFLSRLCGKSYPHEKPRFSAPFRPLHSGTPSGVNHVETRSGALPPSRLGRQGRELLAVVLLHART